MLDSNDPLIALADTIKWDIFEEAFAKHYSKEGRPAKPIRLMVGLLILKQLENLSDEIYCPTMEKKSILSILLWYG